MRDWLFASVPVPVPPPPLPFGSRGLLQGKEGLVIAVRDSNFYIAKCDCNKPEQQTALGAKALAIGGYWVRAGCRCR